MVTQDQKDQFVELRARGFSFDKIAEQIDVSKPTLLKLGRELSGEIERLKYINLEALADKYRMLRESRINSFGALLEKVDSALEQTDLNKVHPEKLLEMKLKLTDRMQGELSESFKIEKNAVSQIIDNEKDFDLKID